MSISVTTKDLKQLSKRILPKTRKRLFLRFTRSFVRASRRQLILQGRISTDFSSTREDTTFRESADISTTKSSAWRKDLQDRLPHSLSSHLWASFLPTQARRLQPKKQEKSIIQVLCLHISSLNPARLSRFSATEWLTLTAM